METVDDFIAHYGVKGMRWGVRKKEETAGGDAPTKRQERAKIHTANADVAQAHIDELKKQPIRFGGKRKIRNLEEERDKELATAKAMEEGRLTPTQKKLLIGGGIAVALVAAYAGYKYMDSGGLNSRLTQIGGGPAAKWKRNPTLARKNPSPAELELIARGANPDFGAIGTTNNCRRCTMAYELRRRGFDVRATRSTQGTGQNAVGMIQAVDRNAPKMRTGLPSVFKRAAADQLTNDQPGFESRYNATKELGKRTLSRKYTSEDRLTDKVDSVRDAVQSMPNGARGELGLKWHGGGGHSIAWEVVNGKAIFIDAQNGNVFDTNSHTMDSYLLRTERTTLTRLDNQPLNHDFLERWVK